jgi:uncharacterized protein involved in exopolysaccharide biosynthesis
MEQASSLLGILWRRRAVVLIALVGLTLLAVPLLRSVMHLRYMGVSHVLMVNNSGRDLSGARADLPLMAQSSTVLSRAVKRVDFRESIPELKKSMGARIAPWSSVMAISVSADNPKLAVDLSNAVADETVTYYRDVSTRRYDDIIHYLRNELDRQHSRIGTLDEQLERAVANYNYVFVGSDRSLEAITSHLDELGINRGKAYADLQADIAAVGGTGMTPSLARVVRGEVLEKDPYYTSMRAEYAKSAAQLSTDRAQFTEKYPGLPGLTERVQREKATLAGVAREVLSAPQVHSDTQARVLLDRQKAEAQVKSDRARVAALDEQLAKERRLLQDAPKVGNKIASLRLERDTATTAYQSLATKLSDVRLDQAQATSLGTLVVLDRALRADAFGPSRILVVLAAFAIVAFAFSTAFVVDAFGRRLRSVDEVEKLYGKVLATIGGK